MNEVEDEPPPLVSDGLNRYSAGKFLNALICLGGHTIRQRGFYNLLDVHRHSNGNQRCQSRTQLVCRIFNIE